MKVSVCMITYNHEKFIAKAIESIITQKTDFDYELVIGEDFSTDQTPTLCSEYQKKYSEKIVILNRDKNVGVMQNFIETLNTCKGKYIAICEGDDYWTDPYKLQKQVDFLDANPDYVMCYHDSVTVDENGEMLSKSRYDSIWNRDYTSDELIKGIARISTLTLCFRNVVDSFPNELLRVYCGDHFLFSFLGNYGKGKYLSTINSGVYVYHKGGIWSGQKETDKLILLAYTLHWMKVYYERIGKYEYAEYFRSQINNLLVFELPRKFGVRLLYGEIKRFFRKLKSVFIKSR